MGEKQIWEGKPPHHKWAILKAGTGPGGNLTITLLRQLTGESLPDYTSITLPEDCLIALTVFLSDYMGDGE